MLKRMVHRQPMCQRLLIVTCSGQTSTDASGRLKTAMCEDRSGLDRRKYGIVYIMTDKAMIRASEMYSYALPIASTS